MKKILSIVLAVLMIASTIAISGIVTASADTAPVQTVDLIPAYGEKNLNVVSNTVVAGEGIDEFSIVDTAGLTGGTEGVPSETAYYFTNNSAASRAGMYFDLPVKIYPVLSELMSYQTIYIDMWIWAESKWGTPNVRLTEGKYAYSNSYVEYNIYDSANFTVDAGWNHVTVAMKLANNAGRSISKFMDLYESMTEGWMPDISIYNHAAADIDYAIAAVRLMTTSSPDETWDLDVTTDKTHYYVGESVSKDDLTVIYKGQEVTDYTMTALDTTTAGRKTFVVTYGDLSATYTIQVKTRGDSVYDIWDECYPGMGEGGNGLGITAGINKDNFRTGNQTIQYTAAQDTQLHLLEPIDLTGEEYLQMWVYMSSDAITPAANYEFLIEISSNDSLSQNCFRYHWTGNGNNGRGKISDTFKEGWTLVQIPLTNNTATQGDHLNAVQTADSLTTIDKNSAFLDDGKIRIIWVHSNQTQRTVDFSNINYIRVRTPSLQNSGGGVILVGGIGYGMDTAINDHKAGNDLVQTFADAKAGDIVSLQNDVTIDETIVIDKEITFDLNRFTLKSSADPIFRVVEGGNLKVVDNSMYLGLSYGEKRFYGDIVSTKADASAFTLNGATDEASTNMTKLEVAANIDVKADYGVDVNPALKAQGNYTCANVEAELYCNFAPSGLSTIDTCSIYVNGTITDNPIITIYEGTYETQDVEPVGDNGHFALAGMSTVHVMGGTFNDYLLSGTTTTAEPKGDVCVYAAITDKVDGVIICGGTWDIDVSNAKAIYGGVYLNDSYKAVTAPELTETDANDAAVMYTGNWTTLNNQKNANNKNLMRASKSGSTAKFSFTGSTLEIAGYKSPTYGKVRIEIVGIGGYDVDLYAETATWDAHLFTAFVDEGTWDVIITVLDEKNEAASNKGLFYAALDTISVDGTINAISDVVETDLVITEMTTDITVEDMFANGAETTGLTNVVAENGSVQVDGNVITYTAAPAASDVITYTMNGVSGKINLTLDTVFEAEVISEDGTNMYSWYFSGRNATILKAGESMSFDFVGSSITIIGYTSLSYGQSELWIDGQLVATLDENAEGYNYQYGLGKFEVGEGTHEVEIKAIGKTLIDSVVIQ